MSLRFYSVPAWKLVAEDKSKPREPQPDEATLEPSVVEPALLDEVLAKVEYRGFKALDRARELVGSEKAPVVFARSPNDLPALLRTADQLVTNAKAEAGERAQLWRCTQCQTRYAVPVALVRPVALNCDRCGATVDLDPGQSEGESNIADPRTASLNAMRVNLAEFFREAMARGWPVLIEKV